MEIRQGAIKERADHVRGHRDFHVAPDLVGHLAQERGQPQDGAVDLDRLAVEELARLGQLVAPGLAVDELPADPIFQSFQGRRDRGLL
ncbi:hypothetical protein GCM10011324_03220 [Allosediminivita pacifica]|nr:hypothetical protein GCM10011324_03220 [Allosediminivita pacifica]